MFNNSKGDILTQPRSQHIYPGYSLLEHALPPSWGFSLDHCSQVCYRAVQDPRHRRGDTILSLGSGGFVKRCPLNDTLLNIYCLCSFGKMNGVGFGDQDGELVIVIVTDCCGAVDLNGKSIEGKSIALNRNGRKMKRGQLTLEEPANTKSCRSLNLQAEVSTFNLPKQPRVRASL